MKQTSGTPMQKWIDEVPNNGIIRYHHVFNRERIMPVSPKALGEVLVHKNYEFVKPTELKIGLGRLLGDGILVAEGNVHKTQRKHLMPAFAFRHIKDLYPIFWSISCEMVRAVNDEVQKEAAKAPMSIDPEKASANLSAVIALDNWLSRATLDIIGMAGMGHNFDSIHNPDNELNRIYRTIFTPSTQAKILGIASLFLPRFLIQLIPIQRNSDLAAAVISIRRVAAQLIREKQEKFNASEKTDAVGSDIISVALSSGYFTEENLVDQLMTFLAAGHETTATSSSWAIAALCQNPSIQTRLREEIRANLPSPNNTSTPVTAELLDKLPFLHAVCNETLRMYSPVPLTRREAANDTTILDQFIPKGTDIIICPYAVNTSTELWGPDAKTFNPDRWMGPGNANSGGAESNYSFLTFLHGPRSCIGQAFAKGEFACLLAAIVGRFEMEMINPGEDLQISGGITARPRHLNVRMKLVEGW
ncbi:hypothetical protein MMC14_005398 [Varicellaria rhodocarpa]|nr:hypothetical protein [Varicellaria rhodocarpa]